MRRLSLVLAFMTVTVACRAQPDAPPAPAGAAQPHASSRVEAIRERGFVNCGVLPAIAGFARVTAEGRYEGLDIDICRGVAAAILGSGERVTFVHVTLLTDFLKSDAIDLVSRRLTWTVSREVGVLFGPIMFYDAGGFLVHRRNPAQRGAHLAGSTVCVEGQSEHDDTLMAYMARTQVALRKVPVANGTEAGRALFDGRCDAFSADISELAAVRSLSANPQDLRILPDRISDEPLAQLVRSEDVDLFQVLRWTIFAMIGAEELGITSANLDEMATRPDPAIRRFLGVDPGNGSALGLDEAWARNVIKAVGNYGEAFDRNLGPKTPIGLARGLNALTTQGGLLSAPPLR